MTGPVELVTGHGERTRRVVGQLVAPFEKAREVCADRLGAGGIEIHVVDAPDECIPEWGLGGYTFGPHSIVLAIDPDHVIRPPDVYATLVHEIHHAMRWRGPGCGTSLGDRLVSEGLAQAFENECTGRVPMYTQGEISSEHRALAPAALDEAPAAEGRWFFGAGDMPRWFGYGLGYEIVKDWLDSNARDAADTVHEPAESFLGGLRS